MSGDQIPPFTEDNAIFHLVGAGRGGGQEPGAGALVIITNYIEVLPGGARNGYLLIGLGLLISGFVLSTRYR